MKSKELMFLVQDSNEILSTQFSRKKRLKMSLAVELSLISEEDMHSAKGKRKCSSV